MGRAIAGVVVGFVVMGVIVMIVSFGSMAVMGVDKMFQPGTHDPSTMTILVGIIGGLAAALIGGLTCAVIAQKMKPAIILALVTFVLGVVMVFPKMATSRQEAKPRTPDEPLVEIFQNAREPVWYAMLHPVIGVVGVLAGGAIVAGGDKKKSR